MIDLFFSIFKIVCCVYVSILGLSLIINAISSVCFFISDKYDKFCIQLKEDWDFFRNA